MENSIAFSVLSSAPISINLSNIVSAQSDVDMASEYFCTLRQSLKIFPVHYLRKKISVKFGT